MSCLAGVGLPIDPCPNFAYNSPRNYSKEDEMLRKMIVPFAALLVLCCTAMAGAATTAKNPVVVIETTLGNIKVELFAKEAPISVKNFLDYATSGFYAGTMFHRVIPNFMIQGGGFTTDRKHKETKAPIKNEANNGLKNVRGTIAMARTAIVDSATSEFFINVNDNGFLDYRDPANYGYAVFGKVVDGMDVVDKIVNVQTGRAKAIATGPQGPTEAMFEDVPVTKVIIESVRLEAAAK
jgi:peptidyl-prolyl cis-trans isomerase A (cyclophilin A)